MKSLQYMKAFRTQTLETEPEIAISINGVLELSSAQHYHMSVKSQTHQYNIEDQACKYYINQRIPELFILDIRDSYIKRFVNLDPQQRFQSLKSLNFVNYAVSFLKPIQNDKVLQR
jgi:hypothetical protein